MKKRIFIGIFLVFSLVIISCNSHEKNLKIDDNNILGIYLDNELQTSIPKKGEAVFSKAVCDNDEVNYYWDIDNWGLYINNFSNKMKCNLYFVNYSGQTTFDFDYTGGEQEFTANATGYYKLETWGAEGGKGIVGQIQSDGGVGGYSSGMVYLKLGEKIYINVGQIGVDGEEKYPSDPNDVYYFRSSYNGGGTGSVNMSCDWGGGGGATHIAIKSGLLSTLESFKNDILIVSGGGGGAGICTSHSLFRYQYGAAGGGYIGNSVEGSCEDSAPTGGTQTSGGIGHYNEVRGYFGQGGTHGSGGGGGFYGGSHGWNCGSGAGGGSGYIGNSLLKNKVMYCYNCEESNEESTKTISTTCNEETPTSYCAKKGNGYARITLVSIDE